MQVHLEGTRRVTRAARDLGHRARTGRPPPFALTHLPVRRPGRERYVSYHFGPYPVRLPTGHRVPRAEARATPARPPWTPPRTRSASWRRLRAAGAGCIIQRPASP